MDKTASESLQTTDASVWAREFIRQFSGTPAKALDEDVLAGWFANAIEYARDHPHQVQNMPFPAGDHQHKIAGLLRVVREKGYGHADLYIDGELFPFATVGGFSVCPRRDQMPGVTVTLAAWRVEVADGNIPAAEEHGPMSATGTAGGQGGGGGLDVPQWSATGSERPWTRMAGGRSQRAMPGELDVHVSEPGDGKLRGDIEM